MIRKQKEHILKDLEKKMVFLTGPRQVGKTWLAKEIATGFKKTIYLNYDNLDDRKIIKKMEWHPDVDLIIFDEIHKMPDWKTFLKGIYDTRPSSMRILVTGSAGLDFSKHAGDSLVGRYFRHQLLPFSMAELNGIYDKNTLSRHLERGGFPEPFLTENSVDADRWRIQYLDGLIRTDVLDFENIHNFNAIRTVLSLLRRSVGSPVSYKSIAEDVQISPNTVKKYIQIFEALYIVFRVTPFSSNIARSLLKEPKIYFYDTGLVENEISIKFENFIAISLLKHIYAIRDYEGKPAELKYLRTKEGLEVDFCLSVNNKAELMIEAKLSDKDLSPALLTFNKKYGIAGKQVVRHLVHETQVHGLEIVDAENYIKTLKL